jgi:glycosyltransferase involved in cell wall biosynthesis
LLGLATQGSGRDDEARLRELTRDLQVDFLEFDRDAKFASFIRVLRAARRNRPPLTIMEGSGIAGGAALMLSRLLFRVPYVFSSGDAISPYLSARMPLLRPLFALYERSLYRFSSGFIGWTPYLTGRALSFGAPRAMTAAGWAPFKLSPEERGFLRNQTRRRFGIPSDSLVVGIVGSLLWNHRIRYCYGYELVQALLRVRRDDVVALIVGGGPGKAHLREAAGDELGRRVILTGQVPRNEVPAFLAAMDIGSLPQSLDSVGSFRYTTKISEYIAAGLPIVTGELPCAYDLDQGWIWRVPGDSPWAPVYIEALARLLDTITPTEIARKQSSMSRNPIEFDREAQIARTAGFIADVLADLGRDRAAD